MIFVGPSTLYAKQRGFDDICDNCGLCRVIDDDVTTMEVHNIFAQASTMISPTPDRNIPFFLYSSV